MADRPTTRGPATAPGAGRPEVADEHGGWRGRVLHVFTAPAAGAPMVAHERITVVPGVGLEGDRYALRTGHYSDNHHEDRQVTLIEVETLEALARDHDLTLSPAETRRNLVTRGVPLNHLVGRRFRVGTAVLYGGRLNVPCRYLERLVDKPVYRPLLNRSGLNCRILSGDVVAVGDAVREDTGRGLTTDT